MLHVPSVGQGSPGMVDARERVTGRTPFVINMDAPLQAAVLRSSSPHAWIRRLDVSRARRVTGVSTVLTGAELVRHGRVSPYHGPVYRDQPVLAVDKVRHVGEPVVAVAAVDLDTAHEALALVDVEYEELPAVFDTDAATAPDAALVHDQPPSTGGTFADIIVHPVPGTNICNYFRLRRGDVEVGFREADEVFEHTFYSPPIQHVPMETHACVAEASGERVVVWASNQGPHVLRSQIAEMFGLAYNRVRVIVPTLGGGYGGKGYPTVEPLAAVLAYFAGDRVKLHLTRAEEFVTVTKHPATVTLRTAVKADGTLVARHATCHFDTGAYANIGPRLIKNGGYGTAGPHRIPHVSIDSYAIYTNMPPAGAFRGYGINQAAWAYDSQLDIIADELGLDPLEVRMKNLLTDGDSFATGEVMHGCHFDELLDNVAKGIDWRSPARTSVEGTRVRGKGLSCIAKSTVTPSTSTAAAKLNDDGSLDVLTSSVEMGQGVLTAMTLIAAEELGVPPDLVNVSLVDTDVTPYEQITGSSRSTYSMGQAVRRAVDEVRRRLLEEASSLLEVAPRDLQLVGGQVQVRGVPSRALGIGEVVTRSRSGNLLGRGRFRSSGGLDPETGQGVASVHWHQAAGAAEVEVDTATGKVTLLRYNAAVYAGRVINQAQADLQTDGNIAFGVGQALFEEMLYDRGQLQNGNLADYMIASILDMPRKSSAFMLENPGSGEVHGIGESALPPVMAAIGNAVFHATGVRVHDLPITPEKVLRALRRRPHGEV